MMKKKMHAFLMMFLIIISLFTGCNGVSEQGNSESHTQNQDMFIEHQKETELLHGNDLQPSETESLQENDTQYSENEQLDSKQQLASR